MGVERWGAFSVVDHKDARKLAAEVLLYDRLVLPVPPDWDIDRWRNQDWDPEGLELRIKQLDKLVIPATWDLERQKQWSDKFNALREDARDMGAAKQMTRRVLAEHGRDYRPAGVGAVEVLAAYQSESDFDELESERPRRSTASEFNFLLTQRLAIPDAEDPEDSLKHALQLCGDDRFITRRKRFHDWQRQILSQGVLPADAAAELSTLVREYNEAVCTASRSFRIETAMLVGGLSAAALATVAATTPAAVVALGIGALQGAQVVSIGNAAIGAVLQIVRHSRAKKEPDRGAVEYSGAMFHQIEAELGWRLRTNVQDTP